MNYEDMVFVQSTTIIPVPDHIFHVYVGNLKFEPFVANPTNQDQSSIYILVALFEKHLKSITGMTCTALPFRNSKLMGFMKISVLITV